MNTKQIEKNSKKEEWGGWKIVSDMLDNPDGIGIYPTSKCYQKLYEFVCKQKHQILSKCIEVVRNWDDSDIVDEKGVWINKKALLENLSALKKDL